MHVVWVIANEPSVPYFNWFAAKARETGALKFTFVALYPERPKMVDEMREQGWNCYWIPFDAAKRKRSMVRALFALYKLFRKLKPDIVHTHLFDDSLPGLKAARWARVPVRVVTKQDTTFHWYYAPKYVRFDRVNNRNATHIQAIATRNREFIIEKEKAPAEKVHLIRHGSPPEIMTAADDATIEKLKTKYNMHGRIVVGTVARLIRWKGHHLTIEAAAEAVKKYPELLFVWAGRGTDAYKTGLEQLIKDKGLENNICFTGWIDRKDIPSFYRCMDIYLHPAIEEPYGFAIAEALMNGVPVASTLTGATDLLEDNVSGIILPENDSAAITAALDFFCSDTERARQIGRAGQAIALKHHTFQRMWDEQLALYQRIIKK